MKIIATTRTTTTTNDPAQGAATGRSSGPSHAPKASGSRGLSEQAGGAHRAGEPPIPERWWSIGELAKELGVSTRTIRFYESSDLIAPQRRKGARIYSRRDRARMHIILRGKNLGFSLDDIRQYLRLYDDDPSQVAQTQLLIDKIGEVIGGLERKKEDLERSLSELREVQARATAFLDRKDGAD